jgi:hypothetical protein
MVVALGSPVDLSADLLLMARLLSATIVATPNVT